MLSLTKSLIQLTLENMKLLQTKMILPDKCLLAKIMSFSTKK